MEHSKTNNGSKNSEKNITFIKEIARYFMDFLETDFHRRRTPKRAVKLHNDNNILIGLNLNKYPSVQSIIWKSINHAFDKNSINSISKGVYTTNIPKNLLETVNLQSNKISDKQIDIILKKTNQSIEKSLSLYKDDYEKIFSTTIEEVSNLISKHLIFPFTKNLEEKLSKLNLGDENNIYIMEEELQNILTKLFEDKISEIIKQLIIEEKINTYKELEKVFNRKEVVANISTFFEEFRVTDLYSDLLEMNRNKNILDKQEFYLYFCDITFNKTKYPIFYIPFSLEQGKETIKINFDAQAYVNKKAIEYVVQEYNKERNKKGSLKTISERIIYLTQHQDDFQDVINEILNEITNFFELDQNLNTFNAGVQTSKSLYTKISNSCYISLFDKSDEALINDYEEILQKLNDQDDVLVNAFNILIEDFIHKNPITLNTEIEEAWDQKQKKDKLIFKSPVPLNEEQLQILMAIRNKECKYITVEGPPGTGKSHTITAIIFDAILKNQSVLVLSDKKEALDVVENKITDTMNKVRHDKNFQNPILRLGKTGNTYSQILSTSTIGNIKNHYRATKNESQKMKDNISKLQRVLKENVAKEILSYSNINIQEIQEFYKMDNNKQDIEKIIEIEELTKEKDAATYIKEIRNIIKKTELQLKNEAKQILSILQKKDQNISISEDLDSLAQDLKEAKETSDAIKTTFGQKINSLNNFQEFSTQDFYNLQSILQRYKNIKNPVFGYLLKNNQIEKLNQEFKILFNKSSINNIKNNQKTLDEIIAIMSYLQNIHQKDSKLDQIKTMHFILTNPKNLEKIQNIINIPKNLQYIEKNIQKYPNTFQKIGIEIKNLETLSKNQLVQLDDIKFKKLTRYIELKQKLETQFKNIPEINYISNKNNLEKLITAQMTYIMDGRLIDFYNTNKSDAKTIRDIIKNKQQFPKNEFAKLKQAFPCILSGIRDYAEYIPLEPEIFDLIIIDEASQVSVSQAFPALLRAKKILILGDKKQFSNVKSSNAKTETNKEYVNKIQKIFRETTEYDQAKMTRLAKFNIKTSILEFFEFISNYDAQLLKHFRGYKEIISYSNKHFYQNNLQVMKIRESPIKDVLKFSVIEPDNNTEIYPKSNIAEVNFIIDELKKIKDRESKSSVCIITPHTNQQKLLMEVISNSKEKDYYFNELDLKIFTFDTCQGEERDIVFYSMVATKELDRLSYIFSKNIDQSRIEEDAQQIRAQRLNVGFSRAKETMHFVLSKPIDKYSGSIKEALMHYSNILEDTDQEPSPEEVDPNSPKEKEVLNWITQTYFWQTNKKHIFLKPQFEIGKYLKQIDKTYNQPNYRVDFLLVYKNETSKNKIIIEYDGFDAHFKDSDGLINQYNYTKYYSEEDIYRQKTLENYGYKFLRINKFNIGKKPIETINQRLLNLINNNNQYKNNLNTIQEKTEGLNNKTMKECMICENIKPLEDFADKSLITGYGKTCKKCKRW